MQNKKTKMEKAPSTSKRKSKVRMGRTPIDVEELMVKIMYDAPKDLNDAALSKYLGIHESTFYDYKANHREFSEVIKHYKRVSPIEVLQSFKKIAVGYSYDETVKELQKDKKTGLQKLVVTKVTTKQVVPSAAAGWNYLKSQMPDEFKEKIETTHNFGGAMDNITLVIKGRG